MGIDQNIQLPWPDWKIIKELGHGGYGVVYQAQRSVAGITEQAAIKVISFPKSQDEIEADLTDGYDLDSLKAKYANVLQGYLNEYNLMRELNGQTNIVNCADFATVPHNDGIGWDVYIRMELLTPLTVVMRQKKLTEEDILKVGKDICRALMLCETKNIIHRDIKPENIMVSEFGDYKLGDFGIARTMDHTTNATMVGTERYMAPEVIRREKYGKEADIYSLGLVLYWMLNNRKIPFIDADSLPYADELSRAQSRRVNGEPLPPPKYGSEDLQKIVLKACEYRPADRYSSAEEMYRALDAVKIESNEGILSAQETRQDVSHQAQAEVMTSAATSSENSFRNNRVKEEIPFTGRSEENVTMNTTGAVTMDKDARLKKERDEKPHQPQAKGKSKMPLIVAAAAVLIIAVLVFAKGFGSGSSGSSSGHTSSNTSGSTTSSKKVQSVSIVCKSPVHVGETVMLGLNTGDVTYYASSPNVTWTVSDPSIAYVSTDGDGGLVGVSEGTVTIKAELDGVTDSINVEVIAAE